MEEKRVVLFCYMVVVFLGCAIVNIFKYKEAASSKFVCEKGLPFYLVSLGLWRETLPDGEGNQYP